MGKLDQEAINEKIKKGKEKEMKEKKKQIKEKIKKEKVSFFTDFKNFIMKGNVLDLAVAVVISTAFNAIVTGLVKYIITPFVTYFTSGQSIEEWEYVLKEAVTEIQDGAEVILEEAITIQYGLWIQTIVDFLIIAFSIFVAVRIIKNTERKLKASEIAEKEAAEAAKKAADAEAAAAAAAAAAEKAAAEKAALDEFYANVKEQSALLREIRDNMNK
ncbi:MAG: large conductance mechanosensitive channel protein MscL [Ruminococcaceae bacterium]|nr:large conductance mechanosensitive channel protein MscL [Oscillospiraceae bacterium]